MSLTDDIEGGDGTVIYKQLDACNGKIRYNSWTEAKRRIEGSRTHWKVNGKRYRAKLEIYKCPYCGGYHQGHKRRKVKRLS